MNVVKTLFTKPCGPVIGYVLPRHKAWIAILDADGSAVLVDRQFGAFSLAERWHDGPNLVEVMAEPPTEFLSHMDLANDLLGRGSWRTPRFNALDPRARGDAVLAARENPTLFLRLLEIDGMTWEDHIHSMWQETISKHKRVVFYNPIGVGETTHITIGRTLWELGRNPNLRVCIVVGNSTIARSLCDTLKRMILEHPVVVEVFPHLYLSNDTGSAFTVMRPESMVDPTVQVIVAGDAILGSRIDHLVLDSIHRPAALQSVSQSDALYEWVRRCLLARVTSGGRVVAFGMPECKDDVLEGLSFRMSCAFTQRFTVNDAPTVWPAERVAKTSGDLGPAQSAKMLWCQYPS